MGGTNYVRSLRGFLILESAIRSSIWKAFWHFHSKDDFQECLEDVEQLKEAISLSVHELCHTKYIKCVDSCNMLKERFECFIQMKSDSSEICRYWNIVLKCKNYLKLLICSDKNGDWIGHLQAVQNLLPIFCECDSINYFQYASWYLEKMRKLLDEHPDIYKEFLLGKFVVKTDSCRSTAVSPDMKLEQTIQRSKKSTGGIIGQTHKEAYVTEWELIYHEILAITNCFNDLTKTDQSHSDTSEPLPHHEVKGNLKADIHEAVAKVFNFIEEKGNPFILPAPPKLYVFSTCLIIADEIAKKYINFFEDGKNRYEAFRKERFIDKTKTLKDTIKSELTKTSIIRKDDET